MWCILYVTPVVTLKETMFWSNLRNDSVLKAEFNSRGRSTVRDSIRVEIFRWKIHTRVPGERRRVAGCVISSHQIVSVFLMKWIRLIFRLGRLPSAGEARRGGQRQPAGFMLISSDVGSDVLSWVQRGRERGGSAEPVGGERQLTACPSHAVWSVCDGLPTHIGRAIDHTPTEDSVRSWFSCFLCVVVVGVQ